jgi:hypothetical protein
MDYLQIDRSRRKSTDLVINPWILPIHEFAVTDRIADIIGTNLTRVLRIYL